MPIKQGKDTKGKFFQYGDRKKYYFTTDRSKTIAYKKALKQGVAIKISQLKHKA